MSFAKRFALAACLLVAPATMPSKASAADPITAVTLAGAANVSVAAAEVGLAAVAAAESGTMLTGSYITAIWQGLVKGISYQHVYAAAKIATRDPKTSLTAMRNLEAVLSATKPAIRWGQTIAKLVRAGYMTEAAGSAVFHSGVVTGFMGSIIGSGIMVLPVNIWRSILPDHHQLQLDPGSLEASLDVYIPSTGQWMMDYGVDPEGYAGSAESGGGGGSYTYGGEGSEGDDDLNIRYDSGDLDENGRWVGCFDGPIIVPDDAGEGWPHDQIGVTYDTEQALLAHAVPCDSAYAVHPQLWIIDGTALQVLPVVGGYAALPVPDSMLDAVGADMSVRSISAPTVKFF